jgi:hypothetical protein
VKKNYPNSPYFRKRKIYSLNFYNSFPAGSQNIKGFLIFFLKISYLVYSQIWLNHQREDLARFVYRPDMRGGKQSVSVSLFWGQKFHHLAKEKKEIDFQ